jgi:hypothetical protein
VQAQVAVGSEGECVFLVVHHKHARLAGVVVFAEILHAPGSLGGAGYIAPFEIADLPTGLGHGIRQHGDAAGEFGADMFDAQHATCKSISRSLPEALWACLGREEKE